jgi:hypothetical protein
MTPIVNGIAEEYEGRVDVRRLNAAGDGRAAFEHYRLRGHPAYVLLLPAGTQLWSDMGLKTRKEIAAQLDAALRR